MSGDPHSVWRRSRVAVPWRTQPGFFPIVPYMAPKAVYVFSSFFPSLFSHCPPVPRGELGAARKNAALLKSRTKIYNAFVGGSKHSGPSNQKKEKEKRNPEHGYIDYMPPPILLASSHTYLKFLPTYSMHAYLYDEHTIYTYMRGAHCFSNHPATCTLFPLTTFLPSISLLYYEGHSEITDNPLGVLDTGRNKKSCS